MINIGSLYVREVHSVKIGLSDLATDRCGNKQFCIFVNGEYTGINSWDYVSAENRVNTILEEHT